MVSLYWLWKQSDLFWAMRPYIIWILITFLFEFIISHHSVLVDYVSATLAFFLFLKLTMGYCYTKGPNKSPLPIFMSFRGPPILTLTCPCDSFWPLTQKQKWHKRRPEKHYTLGIFLSLAACRRSLNNPAVSWVIHGSVSFSGNIHPFSRHGVSPDQEWVQWSSDEVLQLSPAQTTNLLWQTHDVVLSHQVFLVYYQV